MANGNGSVLKIVMWIAGILIGLTVTALTSMNSLGMFQGEQKKQVEHNHEEIVGVKADIKDVVMPAVINSRKHINQALIETPAIQRDIADLKKDFKGFRQEQTDMKSEILEALRQKNGP